MAFEEALAKSRSELSSITFESTSNPRGSQSYSIFGDGACGEPLRSQHLEVDFTPVEELDSDFVQRKCCDFWEFVNSRPELLGLMILPESNWFKGSETKSTLSDTTKGKKDKMAEVAVITNGRTAVSMLEFVEDKGLIDRVFEAKMPQTTCSLGPREYNEEDPVVAVGAKTSQIKKKDSNCKCHEVCKSCSKKQKYEATSIHPPSEVKSLCQNMEMWDHEHPKIKDPPGHPPTLSHCFLQRKTVT